MSLVRSLLARLLAVLLLMQWVGAPVHCLSMATLGVDAGVICHAVVDTTDQPAKHHGTAASLDQACPACHALGYIAPSVAPDVLPQRIAWSVSVAPVRPTLLPPWPSRTRPLQPRAPPETSV